MGLFDGLLKAGTEKQTEEIDSHLTEHKEQDYVKEFLDFYRQALDDNTVLEYTIHSIKQKGVTVKCGPMFCYVPYSRMPWTYSENSMWEEVLPYIRNQRFKGLVSRVTENPSFVVLESDKMQFKEVKLEYTKIYRAIILKIQTDGFIVDLGYDSNWEQGGFIGFFDKINFTQTDLFQTYKLGDIIEVPFYGYNIDGKLILGEKTGTDIWTTGEVDIKINTQVEAEMYKNENGELRFIADNIAACRLINTKETNPVFYKRAHAAIQHLEEGDKINCIVISVNRRKKYLNLIWNDIDDINLIIEKSKPIGNLAQGSIGDLIPKPVGYTPVPGSLAKIEVRNTKLGTKNPNQYFLVGFDKEVTLVFVTEQRIITKIDRMMIEHNLQDRQIIEAQLSKVHSNELVFEWHIAKQDLERLLLLWA